REVSVVEASAPVLPGRRARPVIHPIGFAGLSRARRPFSRGHAMASTGVVTQVIGSTFDAQFPEDDIPAIYNAVKIEGETKAGAIDLFGEVAQHLGGGRVRAVALGSTDGVSRGMACRDTGDAVKV